MVGPGRSRLLLVGWKLLLTFCLRWINATVVVFFWKRNLQQREDISWNSWRHSELTVECLVDGSTKQQHQTTSTPVSGANPILFFFSLLQSIRKQENKSRCHRRTRCWRTLPVGGRFIPEVVAFRRRANSPINETDWNLVPWCQNGPHNWIEWHRFYWFHLELMYYLERDIIRYDMIEHLVRNFVLNVS